MKQSKKLINLIFMFLTYFSIGSVSAAEFTSASPSSGSELGNSASFHYYMTGAGLGGTAFNIYYQLPGENEIPIANGFIVDTSGQLIVSPAPPSQISASASADLSAIPAGSNFTIIVRAGSAARSEGYVKAAASGEISSIIPLSGSLVSGSQLIEIVCGAGDTGTPISISQGGVIVASLVCTADSLIIPSGVGSSVTLDFSNEVDSILLNVSVGDASQAVSYNVTASAVDSDGSDGGCLVISPTTTCPGDDGSDDGGDGVDGVDGLDGTDGTDSGPIVLDGSDGGEEILSEFDQSVEDAAQSVTDAEMSENAKKSMLDNLMLLAMGAVSVSGIACVPASVGNVISQKVFLGGMVAFFWSSVQEQKDYEDAGEQILEAQFAEDMEFNVKQIETVERVVELHDNAYESGKKRAKIQKIASAIVLGAAGLAALEQVQKLIMAQSPPVGIADSFYNDLKCSGIGSIVSSEDQLQLDVDSYFEESYASTLEGRDLFLYMSERDRYIKGAHSSMNFDINISFLEDASATIADINKTTVKTMFASSMETALDFMFPKAQALDVSSLMSIGGGALLSVIGPAKKILLKAHSTPMIRIAVYGALGAFIMKTASETQKAADEAKENRDVYQALLDAMRLRLAIGETGNNNGDPDGGIGPEPLDPNAPDPVSIPLNPDLALDPAPVDPLNDPGFDPQTPPTDNGLGTVTVLPGPGVGGLGNTPAVGSLDDSQGVCLAANGSADPDCACIQNNTCKQISGVNFGKGGQGGANALAPGFLKDSANNGIGIANLLAKGRVNEALALGDDVLKNSKNVGEFTDAAKAKTNKLLEDLGVKPVDFNSQQDKATNKLRKLGVSLANGLKYSGNASFRGLYSKLYKQKNKKNASSFRNFRKAIAKTSGKSPVLKTGIDWSDNSFFTDEIVKNAENNKLAEEIQGGHNRRPAQQKTTGISSNRGESIFLIISRRYIKSAVPVFFKRKKSVNSI